MRVISGFRHEVDEFCDLVDYYAGYSGNSLPTLRGREFVLKLRLEMTSIRCVMSHKSTDLTVNTLDDEIDNFIAILPPLAVTSLGVHFRV